MNIWFGLEKWLDQVISEKFTLQRLETAPRLPQQLLGGDQFDERVMKMWKDCVL